MTVEAVEARRVASFVAHTPEADDGPFLRLHSMARFEAEAAYHVRREGMPLWLFAYTLSGRGRLQYGGETYALTRGTAFLIDCRKPQEYGTDGDAWDFLWVHFGGRLADEYAGHLLKRRGPAAPAGIACVSQWQAVYDLAAANSPGSEALLSAALYQLLTMLLVSPPADERLDAALAYIQEHYAEPIPIEKLAAEACMSPFYFQRRFKEAAGVTPHRYLNRYRISLAKRLLMTTDMPVADVAERVGFASGAHFTETFRRLTGWTPRDYRRAF